MCVHSSLYKLFQFVYLKYKNNYDLRASEYEGIYYLDERTSVKDGINDEWDDMMG